MPTLGDDRLFVADLHGKIMAADITEQKFTELQFGTVPLNNVASPMSVTHDGVTGTLFWTESGGTIRRSGSDGSNPSVVLQIGCKYHG